MNLCQIAPQGAKHGSSFTARYLPGNRSFIPPLVQTASRAGTKREGARQEGNPGFRAREKAFADRIEKARSKAGFPKTLRMSSGGGFRQQGPGLVNEL